MKLFNWCLVLCCVVLVKYVDVDVVLSWFGLVLGAFVCLSFV